MVSLARTKLDVFPLCLGGNVFGWTADERESRAVPDACTAAGGNFIDTANSYLVEHGRSETILGRWLKERGNRDQIVLATKVGGGSDPRYRNLRADTIRSEARTTGQLAEIMPAVTLELSPEETALLSAATAEPA